MSDQPKARRSLATVTGKVARLPLAVRTELNRRLLQGEDAAKVLAWLNALPEVQNILLREFKGRPVGLSHLQLWKKSGFAEWATREKRERLASLGRAAEVAPARVGAQFLGVAQRLGAVVSDALAATGGGAHLAFLRVDRAEVKEEGGFLSLVVNGLPVEVPHPDLDLLARGIVVMRGGPARPAVTIQLPGEPARKVADATTDAVILELVRRQLYRTRLRGEYRPGPCKVPSQVEAKGARWTINARLQTLQPRGSMSW